MTERVVLFVADDCGLCRRAREDLAGAGIGFREARDDRYALRVPVIEVDGAVVTEGTVSIWAVRRALRRSGRPSPWWRRLGAARGGERGSGGA